MKCLGSSISPVRSPVSRAFSSLGPPLRFAAGSQEGFDVAASTPDGIHAALGAGDLTCVGLVERIGACDKRGAAGHPRRIPVPVKDQAGVAGMPTTFGSAILRDFVPGRDATTVTTMRA